jgi:hypothetical protein
MAPKGRPPRFDKTPLARSPRRKLGPAPQHAAPPTSKPPVAPQGLLSETHAPADLGTRRPPGAPHHPDTPVKPNGGWLWPDKPGLE